MPITNSTPPPPRKTAPKPAVPKTESSVTKDRREALAGLGQLAQVPLIAFRLFADAGAVGLYVPPLAREIAALAENQEQIAAFIDPLIKIGPYTGLIAVLVPFVLQIGVNHGRVPAGAAGTVPAVTLQAQVETALASAELEGLRTQYAAEQAAAELRREIQEQRAAVQQQTDIS